MQNSKAPADEKVNELNLRTYQIRRTPYPNQEKSPDPQKSCVNRKQAPDRNFRAFTAFCEIISLHSTAPSRTYT